MNKYFPFNELNAQLQQVNDIILLAIILFLVYIWTKLFLYWDN